jgi:hypothetical protein
MHAWRFWSRAREVHDGRRVAQPAVTDQDRACRKRTCGRPADDSAAQASESGVHAGGTGRYVYVDNFR